VLTSYSLVVTTTMSFLFACDVALKQAMQAVQQAFPRIKCTMHCLTYREYTVPLGKGCPALLLRLYPEARHVSLILQSDDYWMTLATPSDLTAAAAADLGKHISLQNVIKQVRHGLLALHLADDMSISTTIHDKGLDVIVGRWSGSSLRCAYMRCHKPATGQCGNCQAHYYCSVAHFNADWPRHAPLCKPLLVELKQ